MTIWIYIYMVLSPNLRSNTHTHNLLICVLPHKNGRGPGVSPVLRQIDTFDESQNLTNTEEFRSRKKSLIIHCHGNPNTMGIWWYVNIYIYMYMIYQYDVYIWYINIYIYIHINIIYIYQYIYIIWVYENGYTPLYNYPVIWVHHPTFNYGT